MTIKVLETVGLTAPTLKPGDRNSIAKNRPETSPGSLGSAGSRTLKTGELNPTLSSVPGDGQHEPAQDPVPRMTPSTSGSIKR